MAQVLCINSEFIRRSKIKSEGEKTLIMGKPEKVNYQVFPLGFTDNKIKFSSADPEIATVDKNGMIYPKKNGSTQIIVESKMLQIFTALQI